MCGIAGGFGKEMVQRVRTAADTLQHRGPEGKSFYTDPHQPFALGHCRLSIIDGTAAAAQPMRYLNRYVIVHNGELYNYKELRITLEQKGYSFLSQSDTEVILVAYACWGAQCLQQFEGAFSFAIWDEQEQFLFAARDRMGEKPFFFFIDEAQFLFGSEMKALWAAGVSKEGNKGMLYNYLTIGYTNNPFDATETFYHNIRQLPPANYLLYRAGATEVTLTQYWRVDIGTNEINDAAATEQFSSLLTASVQRRLRSDVPIGISLSGGLDSSTIAAICAASGSTQYSQKSFTATFPGYAKDETTYAGLMAKSLGLQQHLVPVGVSDLLQNMDALSLAQEAPVQSASALAQYQVYQAAKASGVTVLLDGQGADELLAGYHHYYAWYWRELYQQGKLQHSNELAAAQALGIKARFGFKEKAAAMLPHFSAAIWQKRKAQQARSTPFLHPKFVRSNKDAFAYAQPPLPTLNGILHYNSFTYGLESLLRYADRNSMAHALEVRLPFLDHHLVAFLFTLPPHFKIRNGWTKWLMRQAMKDKLPAEINWRKDKVGFEPPQAEWMQDPLVQHEIKKAKEILVAQSVLKPSVLRQPIQPSAAHAAANMDWRYWSASYLFR